MKPIYIDIHIHTSEDANKLNTKYNCDLLMENVRKIAGDTEVVLSLTDHNTINKTAYMELKNKVEHLILGVELHIRKYQECPPYHCHMLVNLPIEEKFIDEINEILDKLYPDKCVTDETINIPTIESISNEFDKYDYLLLPHGGQSHRTFDKALKKGKKFDTTLEKSIYYNQFDGFTARSSSGLEETIDYFKRLGINEFINLLTCSDNYNPERYPEAKSKEAEKFTPTWMFASSTFEGLRLSLSESTRLVYSDEMPKLWNECIGSVKLHNERIEMNAKLTPGLNVVIGGSSSGKTLFVDSIYRKLNNDYEENQYEEFDTKNTLIENPSGIVPHYINQNFIVSILQNKDKDINDIPLIAKVFPQGADIDATIRNKLADFKEHINALVDAVRNIDLFQEDLKKIPTPNRLIISQKIQKNILDRFEPSEQDLEKCKFSESDQSKYIELLDELKGLFEENAFAKDMSKEIENIINEINRLAHISKFTDEVTSNITLHKENLDELLARTNQEGQNRNVSRGKLINLIDKYLREMKKFNKELTYISNYNVECKTKELTVRGHNLSIENSFKLTPEIITESINFLLKTDRKIDEFNSITPEMLFQCNFKGQSPKVKDYDDFISRLYNRISELNKRKYKIVTAEGQNFDKLSPGWKSAVILDLILGYDNDYAPIIIDQPEDNLATNYINRNLITLIKDVKKRKQIILVSHNATIPMLGDAQNIVLCRNDNGKIVICSQPLEGNIGNKSIVDYIAEITDGGKSSIKKRVKKYNLKSFKEDE
jgi:hypothetical protein